MKLPSPASVTLPIYYVQTWHSWLGIISLNRIFSKAWAKSASHLSKLWRERKERWSKHQQSWNERMYMFMYMYMVISPLFPKFVLHTPQLCPASPLIQGLSASVCLTGQISGLSIKKLFLAHTCFWWCGRFIFDLGKSVAMFWIPE